MFVIDKAVLNKKHFIRGILIGFIISLAVTIMAWTGHFSPYETKITDLLQSILGKDADDVVLLFITEQEYEHGFGGTSPLSRTRLAELIKVLVACGPRVIALDLDISDATVHDQLLQDALACASKRGIPVVIPCLFTETPAQTMQGDDDNPPYPDEPMRTVREVYEDATFGEQWHGLVMYGGVLFNRDSDGVFRHAKAVYRVKNDTEKPEYPIPCFPITIAAAYQGLTQMALEKKLGHMTGNTLVLEGGSTQKVAPIHIHMDRKSSITPNFIGNYKRFISGTHIAKLLSHYQEAAKRACPNTGNSQTVLSTVFTDKIVLLGGSYDKRDFYMTPIGPMTGMEILANITQNIIDGNLIKHTARWKAFALEVLLGTLVALAFVLTSRFWATVICFTILIPLVVIASLISFSSAYYWFDFVPTISGVLLHGWISRAEEKAKTASAKIKRFVKNKVADKNSTGGPS